MLLILDCHTSGFCL